MVSSTMNGMTRNAMTRLLLALSVVVGLSASACQKFDAPPQATLLGIVDGILPDPSAPVSIQFHEPVIPETLKVRIVLVETTTEGELIPDAKVFFDSSAPEGAVTKFSADRARFTIDLERTLPVGPRLAVEIAPGLSDDAGNAWVATQLIEFAFGFDCDSSVAVPTTFPSAAHFMLVEVEEPIAAQLQLLADIRVDEATGTFLGQFTNADRDPAIDCAAFGLSCAAEQVCRTLPEPACVVPSERAVSSDEYPDFIHNNTPPEGYSFTVTGCVRDQDDGTWAFTNEPVDVEVQSPAVTVVGIGFNASFELDGAGALRGSGTFTAIDILLGTFSSGPGAGSVSMRDVPADEIKPGLPPPPAEPPPAE